MKKALTVLGAFAVLTQAAYAQSYMDGYFHTLNMNYNIRPAWMSKVMSGSTAHAGSSGTASSSGSPAATRPRSGAATPVSESAAAAALPASNFQPVPEERARVIDTVIAGLPESLGRDKQRARVEQLSVTVENSMGADKYNLAKMTYLLIAVSAYNVTGRQFEAPEVQKISRAVAVSYANSESFKRLDDRERSRMYYLFTSMIALQEGLSLSKDRTEMQAGKKLAAGILKSFGVN